VTGSGGPAGGPEDDRRVAALRARRDLLSYIAATRRARRQRAFALLSGALSAVVLAVSGGGWLLAGCLNASLRRVNAGTAPAPAGAPLNILVAGVDVRAGLTRRQQALLHVGHVISHNSDTIMVVHVFASRRRAEVISLPRDSWVRVPGFGMNKINAAIGLGGPRLLVRTVADATGLTINDFVLVNFLGFVRVIDALGGVNICLPFAVHDAYSGLRLPAGWHHVDGVTALRFARDRHSFATSDLARITDQQQLLASALEQARRSGLLGDPVRLARFLSAVRSAITVDRHLDVLGLAGQLRAIPPGAVTFVTVPLATASYPAPSGQSAVLWDRPAARALFASIRRDLPFTRFRRRPAGPAPAWAARPRSAAQAACRR